MSLFQFLRFLFLTATVSFSAFGFQTIHNHATLNRIHNNVDSASWQTMMAASESSDVIVGGVFSLTGQEVSRRLGKSSSFGQVSALVYDDNVFPLLVDDDKRKLSEDSVSPLLLDYTSSSAENNNQAGNAYSNMKFDAAVIATDAPPSPESLECFLEDAAACGAMTAVMLSRMPPSADVVAWRLAEDAAIRSIQTSSLQSLTILRTAELIGGPYYALNPDLLLVSNAKYITTSHRDFSIAATTNNRKSSVRQQDVGMSRPIAAKVLDTVLSLQLGVANVQQNDNDDGSNSSSRSPPRVSILDVASIQGDALTEEDWEERIDFAIKQSVTLDSKSTTPQAEILRKQQFPPFSRAQTLASLAMPQKQVFNNPFMAPPAVSGPYWFFVFLLVVGFGLASQGLTWCNVHWAVDPNSRFYLPVTEKTCACDDVYKICTPVGDLAEGSFRFLKKFH